MATSRTVVVAGAGIGGLTAALALAQRGLRVALLDQADKLEETGAGIQLSPNATRVLTALGLEQRLKADAVSPLAVEVKTARGRGIARVPLGGVALGRYGAPYWTIHRADLQAALLEAVRGSPDIELKLGTRVEDFIVHEHGVTVACRRGAATADEQGIARIGADGLGSGLRTRLGNEATPQYRHRTAWRALIPAEAVAPEFGEPHVHLWLGPDAHLVHYPVKAGALVNVVAIVGDRWTGSGWSEPGARDDLLRHFPRWRWSEQARTLIGAAESWHKWALADLKPLRRWGDGPVTLIGDAAHPMLPFLAQGAGMAIEDAAVLASSMAHTPDDVAGGMRRYEKARRKRTAKVQRAARKNGNTFHLAGAEALVRNLVLRTLGGKMLLGRYDWLYNWRPVPPKS